MESHKKENDSWRNCNNCVHSYVCRFKQDKEPLTCANHIYNADPSNYGDLQELINPVCKWISIHYPSEGHIIINKRSAELEIPIHIVLSDINE